MQGIFLGLFISVICLVHVIPVHAGATIDGAWRVKNMCAPSIPVMKCAGGRQKNLSLS